jgi:hypothetical protein
MGRGIEVGSRGSTNLGAAPMRRQEGLFMLEAVVIIIALGGLEIILWALDHRQQNKQIELLDSIWAELAIRNSAEEEREPAMKVIHS